MSLFFIICVACFLGGCSPSSLEDYRKEGEAFSRRLVEDLQNIHTKEELVRAEPLLKKRFNTLVSLMIAAREYQKQHPDEELIEEEGVASQALLIELKRIYALEGGRDIVERAQREPLIRFDAYEKRKL